MFIRTEIEFRAAQNALVDMLDNEDTPENEERMAMLIHYMEEYIFAMVGSTEVLATMTALQEEGQDAVPMDFIRERTKLH